MDVVVVLLGVTIGNFSRRGDGDDDNDDDDTVSDFSQDD